MYSNHFIETNDGIQLFYQKWVPERVNAVLILVHGAGEHSGKYQAIFEQCLAQDIAVVAPDLRGFGQSEGARGHINTFHDYVEDLHAVVELITSQFEARPVFLFGHSLGGLIVIRYSQLYGYQTNGVILSSPALALRVPIPFIGRKILKIFASVTPSLALNPMKWQRIIEKSKKLKPYLPKEKSLRIDPLMNTEYTPRWLSELVHNGLHAISDAGLIRFPVLCIYDQHDPIVHPNVIQHFFNSITIKDKQFVRFHEGIHHPFIVHTQEVAVKNAMEWIHHRY
ncbi:alpha/beta hydrolase [Gracilibacillus salinarum]|uniref:Alpha/beta hydrolase n=1 Tax=Gracilibacillus salinarum TaxID=2932255 RepID=A0ABY4GP53_9BACI|nr:alpha/beta hydrolase [Gracilibacillus salinarum]UOQ85132.1 alpha/beta hydrolase [Gracilibacillus salinarum]